MLGFFRCFSKQFRLLEGLGAITPLRQSLGAIVEYQVKPDLKNIRSCTAVSLPGVVIWQDMCPLCASVELNRRAAAWLAGKKKNLDFCSKREFVEPTTW